MTNKKLALIIAGSYVGLGTLLYILLLHTVIQPRSFMAIFLPVTYGPFVIEMHAENVVAITIFWQLVMLAVWWGIIYGVLAIFRRQ